ncbi:MAG: sulfotransferase, partial [Planktothrix sp.]|uniref:sulfotransferase n=1 Tax=Planktothrix sp. TaxID=3088171 RepID=UPI0038D3AA6A
EFQAWHWHQEPTVNSTIRATNDMTNHSDHKNKVFGIGLAKTGTTSLAGAMKMLGYASKHYLLNPNVDILKYEFLGDMPIQTRYKQYDQEYPGSKFILTVRDQESWLRSCMNQFHNNIRKKRFCGL